MTVDDFYKTHKWTSQIVDVPEGYYNLTMMLEKVGRLDLIQSMTEELRESDWNEYHDMKKGAVSLYTFNLNADDLEEVLLYIGDFEL
jgi:hypothetical protein